jgi:hypothetical protein
MSLSSLAEDEHERFVTNITRERSLTGGQARALSASVGSRIVEAVTDRGISCASEVEDSE